MTVIEERRVLEALVEMCEVFGGGSLGYCYGKAVCRLSKPWEIITLCSLWAVQGAHGRAWDYKRLYMTGLMNE